MLERRGLTEPTRRYSPTSVIRPPSRRSNETKRTTPRSEHDSHDQKNYDEKYLDMNHFFKSGTHNEAGQMQSGWIQKALFLRSGGAKAKVICDECWDKEHYSGYRSLGGR